MKNKKETRDQLDTKYYKLERLVKWDKIGEVNEMLVSGISPHKVSDWCKEQGFSISHPKLYEYKEMLTTAIAKRTTVERLLGIGVPKRTSIQLQTLGIASAKDMVKNEIELLDALIQRGFNALATDPTIRLQDAMRAIELKNKLTNGSHEGLTNYGLDQLRAVETAKFKAMIAVVAEYVPEDKIPELEERIANAEREYYEVHAPELLDEYERALQEELDSDPDRTIVSDTFF